MKEGQYYPFDDSLNLTIFGYGSDGEELPWREVAKRMRETPREKNSEMLAHLMRVYRKELEYNGEIKALKKFWQEVEKMDNLGFLTDDMEEVLLDAKAGNIKAVQVMIRANPYVIHLPFIAQVMRYVIFQHKYCDPKTGGPLSDIKIAWSEFLPKRAGGNVTYSHADLKKLILLAEKQISEEGDADLIGDTNDIPGLIQPSFTLSAAIEAVAKELNISEGYINKNIKFNRKRGRPKK